MSYLCIEGVIRPSCRTCAFELLNGAPCAELIQETKTYKPDEVETLIRQSIFEDQSDPTFWQRRTVLQMMKSPSVVSMGFIPNVQGECQWLFWQRLDYEKNKLGFYAPYLNKEDRQRYEAEESGISFFQMTSLKTAVDALYELPEIDEAKDQLCAILGCFWFDLENHSLYVNFCAGNVGYSIGWTKICQSQNVEITIEDAEFNQR